MFAMSERGHGSNVRGIQTEAHYDASSEVQDLYSSIYSLPGYMGGGMLCQVTRSLCDHCYLMLLMTTVSCMFMVGCLLGHAAR